MKLEPEPKEIDLYVSNKKVTERGPYELSEFIEEYKKKQALKQ